MSYNQMVRRLARRGTDNSWAKHMRKHAKHEAAKAARRARKNYPDDWR